MINTVTRILHLGSVVVDPPIAVRYWMSLLLPALSSSPSQEVSPFFPLIVWAYASSNSTPNLQHGKPIDVAAEGQR